MSLHCHHQNDCCLKMGSDVSHFNVSLTARDKVTRQCPQTTTPEKKGETKCTRWERYGISDGTVIMEYLLCAIHSVSESRQEPSFSAKDHGVRIVVIGGTNVAVCSRVHDDHRAKVSVLQTHAVGCWQETVVGMSTLVCLRPQRCALSLSFSPLSVCLSVCLPACLSVCLSACLFVCLCLCL